MHFWRFFVICVLVFFSVNADSLVKVGVYNFEPLIFVDSSGKPAGVFIDIIESAGSEYNWKIEYISGSWAECLKNLDDHTIDILPCIGYSEERARKYQFTSQYIFMDWGVVFKNKESSADSLFDLSGKKVAVLKKSIYTDGFLNLLKQFDIKCTIVPMDEYKQCFSSLSGNKVDFCINTKLYGAVLSDSYPDITDTQLIFSPVKIHYASAFNTANNYIHTLDVFIEKLKKDNGSVYYDSLKKWVYKSPVFSSFWHSRSGYFTGFSLIFLSIALIVFIYKYFSSYYAGVRFRQLTNEHLRANAEKYSAILNNISDLVCEIDADGNHCYLNSRYHDFLGYSPDELLGVSAFDIIHPDDADSARKEFLLLLEKHQPASHIFRIAHKNGDWKIFECSAQVYFNDSGEVRIAVVSHDITERQKFENNLRESEEKFRAIAENTLDFIMRYDSECRFLYVNPAALKVLGLSEADILHKNHASVGYSFDLCQFFEKKIREVINMKQNRYAVFEWESPSGPVIIDWRLYPEYDSNGNVVSVLGISRDITEQSKIEEQLYQAQKMQALGQLSGGIAHDFNNMLSGITGSAEIIKLKVNDNEISKYVDLILQSANRASDLISMMLNFARKTKMQTSVFNLFTAVEEACAILERTMDKRIKILLQPCKNDLICGNIVQMQNVFLNLGINAVHAMPDGGTLSFTGKNLVLDSEYCTHSGFNLSPGDYVEIQVRDTGAGISHENIKKIFEPFFTTKSFGKGTGLGLSLVYSTIVSHMGMITVNSCIGKGTVFHIILPLHGDKQDKISEEEQAVSGNGVILVIDDEPLVREITGELLQSLNYKILFAENGIEGVKVFSENAEKVDLIILDMIMPQMNGRDCFIELRKIRPDVKIIVLSGFARDEELEELKILGLDGFVTKPVQRTRLSKLISSLLEN